MIHITSLTGTLFIKYCTTFLKFKHEYYLGNSIIYSFSTGIYLHIFLFLLSKRKWTSSEKRYGTLTELEVRKMHKCQKGSLTICIPFPDNMGLRIVYMKTLKLIYHTN